MAELKTEQTGQEDELPPLSPAAIAAREKVRAMVKEMEEAERTRRISEEKTEPDKSALEKLVTVQEDLIRSINLRKVKEAEELERWQRITEDKKRDVHDELVRKAAQKEILKEEEKERLRRIEANKDASSEEQKERMKTYDRLVNVQEDLLRHIQKLKADAALKEEQQQRITEMNKAAMQEQLMTQVHRRQAAEAYQKEQERQIDELEHLTEKEIENRVAIAARLLQVQKELLSTHKPTQAIPDHHADQILEDFKMYMQEQLIRKANQKEAIAAMEEERKRRVAEGGDKSPKHTMSDQQAAVLEEVSRKANLKDAKAMFEETQQEYIRQEQKTRAQEAAMRQVHQKQADKAMDKEQKERIASMEGKPSPTLNPSLKKEIVEHK